mmetsp:Transcript_10533/g.17673  ORF Transcript_10533/g.17673 Transcript_10533/m.17673 type:complete len:119 (+) Transcript_10533:1209-1565(+)
MVSLDKNCNGLIDYTEFITAASDKTKLLNEKNLKFAFNMIDKDQDGNMTKQELRMMFESSEQKDEKLWSEIFDEVDLDKDGKITYDEFVTCMNQVVTNTLKASQHKIESMLRKDIPDV